LSFLDRRFSADDLMQRARRRTGLDDFGDARFEEGLEVLLQALAEDAALGLFGHWVTARDIVRFLSNLLRLRREEELAPDILDQPIERPLFITGLPRSGTTFLHQLLAEDPANLVPRVWQMIHPYPIGAGGRGDHRRKLVSRQLRLFQLIAPRFHSIHPIGADSPQECSEITAHVFASARFDTTYFVPSYRQWLDRTGHLQAYRFHKRFLQHLQHQAASPGRWVLKCPDHVFALDAIRAVYPDARAVFVHRDPLRVLPSVAHLTDVLRRPFTRRIDRAALGRQESERWLAGAELMIAAADAEPFAEPIFHIDHRDLVDDPLGTVRALYRHFGLEFGTDAAARILTRIAAEPRGGYGRNHYRWEDYALDPVRERERFKRYAARFASNGDWGRQSGDRGQGQSPDRRGMIGAPSSQTPAAG